MAVIHIINHFIKLKFWLKMAIEIQVHVLITTSTLSTEKISSTELLVLSICFSVHQSYCSESKLQTAEMLQRSSFLYQYFKIIPLKQIKHLHRSAMGHSPQKWLLKSKPNCNVLNYPWQSDKKLRQFKKHKSKFFKRFYALTYQTRSSI